MLSQSHQNEQVLHTPIKDMKLTDSMANFEGATLSTQCNSTAKKAPRDGYNVSPVRLFSEPESPPPRQLPLSPLNDRFCRAPKKARGARVYDMNAIEPRQLFFGLQDEIAANLPRR